MIDKAFKSLYFTIVFYLDLAPGAAKQQQRQVQSN